MTGIDTLPSEPAPEEAASIRLHGWGRPPGLRRSDAKKCRRGADWAEANNVEEDQVAVVPAHMRTRSVRGPLNRSIASRATADRNCEPVT
ncbi:hypothetical protein, partial [Nonomuraea sp. NPDC050691]|uniref:hypothetical protein n=1 Tax=Nonomuraea sp. NPDC050691 TaxID=3155661 RepID=UPI0034023523